jgi:hypothetical protein
LKEMPTPRSDTLAQAFALGPERVRKLAADGEDFAALRSAPRRQQLME